MRYNGGKARIAKYIAPIVNAERAGRFCWEPFCGGLGMTAHLKPDLASDAHPGLIALYNKLRVEPGWLEGFDCTEADYAFAKTLADDDPIKAFIGFGCSFGGNWFRALAKQHPKVSGGRAQSIVSANTLKIKLESCAGVAFSCGSFFDVVPSGGSILYLDPPYADTVAYSGVPAFDHARFCDLVEGWTRAGSICFVSEYTFPLGQEVWSRTSHGTAGAGVSGRGKELTERLYRCG